MRLAVSSIAWSNEEEAAVAEKLAELGVGCVEIAPTKLWEDPVSTDEVTARKYVEWWKSRGIDIVAFQSMLFARPDLKLFEDKQLRQEMADYLAGFLRLAGVMGVKRLVFGSPKNRQRGTMSVQQADDIAAEFFGRMGDEAQRCGVVLCLEPNASQYNCDYITTSEQGAALVERVGNPGFGLHLDAACMALEGEELGESIRMFGARMQHFHASSPMLELVTESAGVQHEVAANALRDIGYDGVVSIEMRPGEAGRNVQRVHEAVEYVKRAYAL